MERKVIMKDLRFYDVNKLTPEERIEQMREWADDAVTHNLYVSECEEKFQSYYTDYLINIGRQDLVDIKRKESS